MKGSKIVLSAVLLALCVGMSQQAFAPYGLGAGDTQAPFADDFNTVITLPNPAVYQVDQTFQTLSLNMNGYLVTGSTPSYPGTAPQKLPLTGALADTLLFAPFLANVDTSSAGTLFYRTESSAGNSFDATLNTLFGRANFVSNNRLFATWDAVRHHGVGTTTNTFQLALYANGTTTYACFNYGAMNWAFADTENGAPGIMGLNYGNSQGFISFTRNDGITVATAATGTNTGVAGQYCADITAANIVLPCTLADRTAPTFVCPANVTNVITAPDRCDADIFIAQPAYNDNCGVVAFRTGYYTPFPVARNEEIQFTYADSTRRTASCVITIEVKDIYPPNLVCPATLTAGTPDATRCRFLASLNDIVVSDNCGDTVITQLTGIQNGTFIDTPGTYGITFEVADKSGNTVPCSTSFVTQDTAAPLIDCAPLLLNAPVDSCSVPFPSNFLTTVVTRLQDNCDSVPQLSVTPRPLTKGANFVDISAVDVTGNTAICTSTVTVEDRTAPVITCPANQIFFADSTCKATLNLNLPTISDNCDSGLTATNPLGPPTGTVTGLGTNTITYVVQDSSFNSNTCKFNATVEDRTAPTITCPGTNGIYTAKPSDINQAACSVKVVIPTPTTSDNCGGIVITQTAGPLNNTNTVLGTYTVTLRATDIGKNFAECTFTFKALDQNPPSTLCNPVSYDAPFNACQLPLPRAFISDSISTLRDNCDSSPTSDTDFSTILFLGENDVDISFIDDSGNEDFCTAVATLFDVTAPIINCPLDPVEVSTLPGTCDGIFSLGPVTASDNCDAITPTQVSGPTPGSNTGRGSFTAVFDAIDLSGNMDSCSISVTVLDGEDPVVDCPATLSFSASSPSSCGTTITYTTPTSTDNCDTVSTLIDDGPSSGSFVAVGTSTIDFYAVDTTGNVGFCSTDVIVTDTSDPRVTCVSQVDIDSASNRCGADFPSNFESLALSNVGDNCGIADISYSTAPLTIGDNFITVVVTDTSGRTASCTTNLHVIDTTDPSATCPPPATFYTKSTECAGAVSLSNPTGTDNCGIDSAFFTDFVDGDFGLGSHTANGIVIDTAGRTDSCSTTFTVVDDDAPVTDTVPCPSAPIKALAATGKCAANVTFPLPNFKDNCAITVNNYNSTAPGGSFMVGTTYAKVNVADAAGNTNFCNFQVLVEDKQAPVINCSAQNLVTAPAQCSAPPVNPPVTDNCAVSTITTTFSGNLAIGLNSVPWTATDIYGNQASCNKPITVVDNQPPTIVCRNISVFLVSPSFSSTVAVTALYSSLTDNCPIAVQNVNANRTLLFGYDDTNTPATYVKLTATDASGNNGTCVSRVNVSLSGSVITDPTNGSIRFIGQSFTIRWFQLPGLDPNRRADIWLANDKGVFIKYLIRNYLFSKLQYPVTVTGVAPGFYQIHMILQGSATEVPYVTIQLSKRI
eukprot:CAMPEP_0184334826 /NCGR_PEP_ID=MMETSP1089-20130417/3482_1 /TAXON_ID=38269 ORGANISM="Gloeochaete wittrockiana, Strain SAG46.84" /NCGR_SAMPLE_ID=MMETSP1089 /ASSEMBLY_ACC=CAM_ASM_000445 /LENGTH=1423 /DNA_ID=CAMNT_0026659201 /DNA_START=43 /DNA_END=4314 /DNA_ORIENTATION=+